MIRGIGTDIVQIPRIEKLLVKFGEAFARKILSDQELTRYKALNTDKMRAMHLAKRFAAKEAMAKALGTGVGASINFHDISVLNDSLGKPYVECTNKITSDKTIHISISDDYPVAVAFVIISVNI